MTVLDSPLPSPWARSDREREREAKRDAVLYTAARLFNEKGFHATSLDEVAEALGVTKPTLYRYVKNKDEILFECVRIALEMMRSEIAAVSQRGGSTIEQLTMCMRVYTRIVTQDLGMCVIRVGEDPLPPASRRKLRKLKGHIDQEFRRLIEQGVKEGVLAACDAKFTAFTLAGAISWIGRWYQPGGARSADEIADQCIAVLMNGILRRPADRPAPASPRRKTAAS